MLGKVRIQGFQSHVDTTVEFAPHITSLRGESNHGKTAILRALRWVLLNKPASDSFINHDTKKCTVTLDNVVHTKTANSNSYVVDGKEYKALKGGVPQEVLDALQLTEDNIQRQHEALFLLDVSPGKVAEKLSTLVDLNIAHKAIQIIKQKKANNTAQITANTILIAECDEIISELDSVDDAIARYTELAYKDSRIHTLRDNHATLLAAVKNVQDCEYRLSRMPSIDSLEIAYQLKDKMVKLASDKKNFNAILTLVTQIEELRNRCLIFPEELLQRLYTLKKDKSKIVHIKSKLNECRTIENSIKTLMDSLKTLELVVKDALGDKCPLCKQEIKG